MCVVARGKNVCISEREKKLATPNWVDSARGVGNQMRDNGRSTEIIEECLRIESC